MAKLSAWLLSLIITIGVHHSAMGQIAFTSDSCLRQEWKDGVTNSLFKLYYPGKEWQLYCDSILKICPEYDYIWQMKAMPSIKMGIYEVAFSSLKQACRINPVKQIPYQAFLKCTFAKDYQGALKDFEQAEQLVREGGIMDHSFSFYRGLCYLGLERPELAIEHFESDIKAQTKRTGAGNEHYNSLFYLGLSYLLAHDLPKAEKYLRASIKAYSKFPEPNFYMGKLLAEQNRSLEAKEYFTKAKEYIIGGANMNEDNTMYVDYPFQIGLSDIKVELSKIP
ncbi:MAG: hypothetical protein V4561_07905 [Bacteroidota bacterium]